MRQRPDEVAHVPPLRSAVRGEFEFGEFSVILKLYRLMGSTALQLRPPDSTSLGICVAAGS